MSKVSVKAKAIKAGDWLYHPNPMYSHFVESVESTGDGRILLRVNLRVESSPSEKMTFDPEVSVLICG